MFSRPSIIKERYVMNTRYNQNKSIFLFVLFYLLITVIFIAIGPKLFSSDWVSSSDFHACIEISSSFIAIIAGVACMIYYFGMKSRYFLIVGLGFFISGSEDIIHGLFAFKRLFEGTDINFDTYIPGTYVTGRCLLAILITMGGIFDKQIDDSETVKREAVLFSLTACFFGGVLTGIAFKLPLPQFIYPDRLISRPVDFFSAILFIIAFFVISKRFHIHRDIFSGMLLSCILLNICGQIYMSFSKKLFDVFFDTAHWANILSYCMPVIGITIESLSKMKQSAKQIEILKKVIKSMNESANRVNAACEKITYAVNFMSKGISEQAANIEETSASLEEISSMTKNNLKNARQSDSAMKKAATLMSDLNNMMDEISESSEKTSKIIKTIDEIAFQTNLLALNAAVEAARAGDAGSGFAVVADEVRNLAMRAAGAAKETSVLIESVAAGIKNCSEIVTKTDDSFTTVAHLSGEISGYSKEQDEGIGQINRAINEVEKIVMESVSHSENAISASEELNVKSEQMREFARELIILVNTNHDKGIRPNDVKVRQVR